MIKYCKVITGMTYDIKNIMVKIDERLSPIFRSAKRLTEEAGTKPSMTHITINQMNMEVIWKLIV